MPTLLLGTLSHKENQAQCLTVHNLSSHRSLILYSVLIALIQLFLEIITHLQLSHQCDADVFPLCFLSLRSHLPSHLMHCSELFQVIIPTNGSLLNDLKQVSLSLKPFPVPSLHEDHSNFSDTRLQAYSSHFLCSDPIASSSLVLPFKVSCIQ